MLIMPNSKATLFRNQITESQNPGATCSVVVLAVLAGLLVLCMLPACAQTKPDNQSRARRVTRENARTLNVRAGGSFQAALNEAQFGDTIILEAGATYTTPSIRGFFLLPAKSGGSQTDADYITIRSSRADKLSNGRVTPADRVNMAKVVALGSGGALGTENNSRYWKIVGLEITNRSSGTADEHVGTLVELGNYQSGVQKLWFDRCYVHPQEDGTTDYTRTATRGFGVNGVKDFRLSNSHVSGFMGHYQHNPADYIDSEAIASNIGHGYLIENNFLQGHFNTIFLGGGGTGTNNTGIVQASPAPTLTSATLSTVNNLTVGDYISFPQPTGSNANARVESISGNSLTFTKLDKFDRGCSCRVPAVPPHAEAVARWNGEIISDAIVRRNTFDIDTANAQYEFDTYNRRMPKGYLEIKHCDTCLFEGNIFQGWPSVIALNSVNQNGDSPWTTIKNFTFKNNWIKNFGTAFSGALGNPKGYALWHMATEGTNIVVENNLFTQTNNLPDEYGYTKIAIWGYGNGVVIKHNTFINSSGGGPMFASNGPITNFTFKDNIAFNNMYGMNCGLATFSACYPKLTIIKNVIVRNAESGYSLESAYPNNYIAQGIDSVGFTNFRGGDYRLASSSRFKGKGSDGSDPGVNFEELKEALGISG